MSTTKRLLLVVTAVLLSAALAVGPVLATEGGGGGGAGDEAGETTKIQLPESARDRVGLILLGLGGIAVVLAGANAISQLRGRRPQATGEWRWR